MLIKSEIKFIKGEIVMFAKILFPIDFSDYSIKLIEHSGLLKDLGVEELVLLHVVDKSARNNSKIDEAKELLETFARKFSDYKVKVVVKSGLPHDEIGKVASEEEVSLVYMGGKGENWLSSKLLGNVAEKVASRVDVPLMFVKFRIWEEDDGSRELKMIYDTIFEKILFATDFSDKCNELKNIVKEMALRGDKKVVITSIAESGVEEEELMKKAIKLKREFEDAGIHVKMHIKSGNPGKEIVKIADFEAPSLVVIGSSGRGGARGIGKTAESVLKGVESSVFLYK